MQYYEPNFMQNGFDRLDSVACITENDLITIQILVHRRKIMSNIEQMRLRQHWEHYYFKLAGISLPLLSIDLLYFNLLPQSLKLDN